MISIKIPEIFSASGWFYPLETRTRSWWKNGNTLLYTPENERLEHNNGGLDDVFSFQLGDC